MKKANGLESFLGSRRSASLNGTTRARRDEDLDTLEQEDERLEQEAEAHDPDEIPAAAPELDNDVIDTFLRRRA